MKILLNGQEKSLTSAANLNEIIHQFCKNPNFVIAEVNGNIVKSPKWPELAIKDGDAIELVSFVGGG